MANEDKIRRASKVQILLKIDEALSRDLSTLRRPENSRNRTDNQKKRAKAERDKKRLEGTYRARKNKNQTFRTRNSWQDIADFLEKASAEEGINYPLSKSSIYQYLKIFEKEYNVRFKYADAKKAESLPPEKRAKLRKVYRYNKKDFINAKLRDDIETTMISGSKFGELEDYLKTIEGESSLSIWARIFIKNISHRRELTKVVSFYESDSQKNHYELFGDLVERILNKKPIRFYIRSYDKATNDFRMQIVRMHPYLLKNYNQRWFLIGRTKDEHDDTKLSYYEPFSPYAINEIILKPEIDGKVVPAIDDWTTAIIDGHEVPIEYDGSTNTEDHLEVFNAAVGVTIKGEQQIVLLKFPTSRYVKYVETKPLVGGDYQRRYSVSEDGKFTTVKIQTYLNRELEQKILSFGPDCEVLSPKILRDSIASKVKQMMDSYLEDINDL